MNEQYQRQRIRRGARVDGTRIAGARITGTHIPATCIAGMRIDGEHAATTLQVFRPRLLHWALLGLLCCALLFHAAPQPAVSSNVVPDTVLWAWERPEDLSELDPKKFGVAYLACHVFLCGDTVHPRWRQQPLKVADSTIMIPVVRIDTSRKVPPGFNAQQTARVVDIICKAAGASKTAMVQIDFDAMQSERPFYEHLLQDVRSRLPRDLPISITALTSWCLYDNWMANLPVVETVPMMFSLGRDRQKILLFFQSHVDFMAKSCCDSLGISLEDEEVNRLIIPIIKRRADPGRVYVFTKTRWTDSKVQAVRSLLGKL
jgi:hypothetical protein